MCLTLREANHEPYNESKIRWKALLLKFTPDGCIKISSSCMEARWHFGAVKRATVAKDTVYYKTWDIGIHTFVHKKHAIEYVDAYHSDSTKPSELRKKAMRDGYSQFLYVVAKVEVSRFNASGTYCDAPCETWKRAELLDIFYGPSQANISHFIRRYSVPPKHSRYGTNS